MTVDNEVERDIVKWVYREIVTAKSVKYPLTEIQFKKTIRIKMKKLTDVAVKEAENYKTIDKVVVK